jgi:hypothetical protein
MFVSISPAYIDKIKLKLVDARSNQPNLKEQNSFTRDIYETESSFKRDTKNVIVMFAMRKTTYGLTEINLDDYIYKDENAIVPPTQLNSGSGFHYWCADQSAGRMNGEQRAKPATRTHTFDLVKEKQLPSEHVPCHCEVC